jgi:hypothetical protein
MQSHDAAIETLDRQHTAKLVQVTALNVDPPPERDRLGINARTPAATKQCNECDIPGAGLVEACRFGGARVYGRYRQIWRHVAEGMRIAYCEIVQSSLDSCIPANWKVRLVAINVERAAMNAPDPEPFIAGFAGRERHRQIILPCF